MVPSSSRPRTLVVWLTLTLAVQAFSCASEVGHGSPVLAGVSAHCIACHAPAAEALRADPAHRGNPAGCLACHGEHEGGAGLGRVELVARCEGCHAGQHAQFSMPFRHPLGGDLGCTSCHPPHGLSPRESRTRLRRDVCLECHREYAAPFLFEHEGDRTLQCLSCHEPHGSPNRRLLTHADSRMLCMSCHAALEGSHRQNPGSPFRECLHCHTEVHGSNWNRELLR